MNDRLPQYFPGAKLLEVADHVLEQQGLPELHSEACIALYHFAKHENLNHNSKSVVQGACCQELYQQLLPAAASMHSLWQA